MRKITIPKDVRVPGTDVILEAGDSIQVLNEASVEQLCPYDLIAEGKGGRQIFRMKAANGAVIKQGEQVRLSYIITHNDGSVRFLVESEKFESLVCYDMKKEAIRDGWEI